jgi:5-formyltetrahydrofolate cyclo-ligase
MVDAEMTDKAAVRAAVLRARREVSAAVREPWDAALVGRAVELARGRRRVAAYAPMTAEPGGPALPAALAAVVEVVLLPVLLPDRDLDWAAWDGPLSRPGVGGFPTPDGPRLGPDAIASAELVFVPAVAVDPAGHRLGRGGGSYDRALARLPAGVPALALLYPGELIAQVTVLAHDQPVTGVLLPDGLQSCGSRPAPG